MGDGRLTRRAALIVDVPMTSAPEVAGPIAPAAQTAYVVSRLRLRAFLVHRAKKPWRQTRLVLNHRKGRENMSKDQNIFEMIQ